MPIKTQTRKCAETDDQRRVMQNADDAAVTN